MSVTIILGSKNDSAIAKSAVDVLKELGIKYDVHVASAHRTPKRVQELVESSVSDVFIAVAGLSAALPGVVAAHTTKPVIGVPVSGKVNLDSILSIVQMPPGVPVAAVGLDMGANAALLAAEMLALKDKALEAKLKARRKEMHDRVVADSKEVASL
jgi:5-(carboxyamino)imidazole ribonucleotide mutase